MNEEILNIIARTLDINSDLIEESDSLVWDLFADSMNLTEIVCNLEESYNISIQDSDVGSDPTVGDIIKLVKNSN